MSKIDNFDDQACVTRITQHTGKDYFVAGRVFLEKYYTTFSNSPSKITISQVNPVQMSSNQQDTGLIVTMLVVGLLFCLLAIVCLCCLCFKNIGEIPTYEKRNVAQEAKVENRLQQPISQSVYRPQPQQQVIRTVGEPVFVSQQRVGEPVLVSQKVIPSSQMMSSQVVNPQVQMGQMALSQQVMPGQVINSQNVINGQYNPNVYNSSMGQQVLQQGSSPMKSSNFNQSGFRQ